MSLAYFTICARNYLAYATVLRESFEGCHPGEGLAIYVVDAEPGEALPEGARALPAGLLPDHDDMAFRYDVTEFSTAVKPYLFAHLLAKKEVSGAVYLDPDIQVFSQLSEVAGALGSGADAVVTPHLCAPLPPDGRRPSTHEIHRTGVFNLGFVALAASGPGRGFARWWAERCRRDCVVDLDGGLFVDQKFAEWLPCFVPRCSVLQHPGYNVAYWNLGQRPLGVGQGGWRADGQPLRFFHFSGVSPERDAVFSKYQDRFDAEALGLAARLADAYRAKLRAADHARWRQVPYRHDRLAGGGRIPKPLRRLYAAWTAETEASGEPRPAPFLPHLERAAEPAPDIDPLRTGQRLSRYMLETIRLRPDLQALFPLSSARGRAGFADWFAQHAEAEGLATSAYLPPASALTLGTRARRAVRSTARSLRARSLPTGQR